MAEPRYQDVVNDNQRLDEELASAALKSPPLPAGVGGGTSGGMDPWQQTVETRLGELRADVGALKVDVAVLVERVSHLPTKGFIVSALLTAMAILAALGLFGPNLRTLLGIH